MATNKSRKSKASKGRAITAERIGRNDIVKVVAKSAQVTQVDALNIIETFLNTIRKTTAKGTRVTFNGFGTFETRERAARTAKVFAKGTTKGKVRQVTKQLPAKVVIRFKPSDKFFEA